MQPDSTETLAEVPAERPARSGVQPTLEGEVLWEATPSQIINLGYWAAAALLVAAGLIAHIEVVPSLIAQGVAPGAASMLSYGLMGAGVVYALWRFLVVWLHAYTLTNVRFKEAVGVFIRRHNQMELFRIKDIAVQQPLHLLIFGLGNLSLATTDRTHPIFPIRAVRRPTELADQFRELVQQTRWAEGVRAVE